MTPGNRLTCLLLLLLAGAASLASAEQRDHNRDFQGALAKYNSGQLSEAATQLERLIIEAPESFDVHELLGLVYAAQSQDAKASEHFEKAVRLKPNSAAARTNFAASLARQGKFQPAEEEFKKAIRLEPRNFDANHNLGELYARSGRIAHSVPFFEQAQRVNPSSYDNGYNLSLAYLHAGRTSDAQRLVQDLLRQKNSAELHNLLGEINEKDGQYIAAANEFETAAHLDPSESNLFDWGSELLVHRTLDPAIEVFRQATQRYPQSSRLAIGLSMALYSRANYDDAVKSLLRAVDLDPSDPRAYHFLAQAYNSSPAQAEEVIQHFRRFAELQPRNPRALYYYAMSLWKGRRTQDAGSDLQQVESLLKAALKLDPTLADAHLQLGNLYSDQKRYAEGAPEYVSALKYDPKMSDAHYRLGQIYIHTGEKQKAQEQFEMYQRSRAEHMAEVDRQEAEIRQFVYTAKSSSSSVNQ